MVHDLKDLEDFVKVRPGHIGALLCGGEHMSLRRAGMEYVSIPVGHEDVDDGTFDKFRELMTDQVRCPVLVRCSSANRVGALLVPYLVLGEGKSAEETLEVASRGGLRSDELKRAALRYAA